MSDESKHETEAIAVAEPDHYGPKLTTIGTLGWICAWLFFPRSFIVWLALVGVYSLLLASFNIALALGYRGSVAQRQWRERFFRTSGWLVMSGVLSIVIVIVFMFVRAILHVGS